MNDEPKICEQCGKNVDTRGTSNTLHGLSFWTCCDAEEAILERLATMADEATKRAIKRGFVEPTSDEEARQMAGLSEEEYYGDSGLYPKPLRRSKD
jgi:hypothetical protein